MKSGRWVVPALALAYAGAAALYGWQAWSQGTPWIFPDETLHARAAQSIAGAGSASLGPVSGVLYSAVISPAWLFHDPVTSYNVAKLIGALVMPLAIVPAYLLARLYTGRLPAFAAAVASVAIPGMFYSSLLMQEAVAYPYATLVLYVLARGIARTSRPWLVAAFVLGLLGPLIRPELVVLPIVVVLAVLIWIWFGEWATRKRAGWTAWHWCAAVAVFVAVLFALAALGAAVSVGWRVALQNPDDLVRYAALALGPFAAGVAILPVLAGPAVLSRRSAFMPVFVAAVTTFLVYVAAKEAFLASRPAIYKTNDLLGERNLVYLSPLVFAATAIWAERRRVNVWALGGATAVLVGIFAWIPYVWAEDSAPHSPTVVSISHIASGLSHPTVRAALIVATVLAALVLLLRRTIVLAAAALVIVGWSLTGEVNASNKSLDIGQALVDTQPTAARLDRPRDRRRAGGLRRPGQAPHAGDPLPRLLERLGRPARHPRRRARLRADLQDRRSRRADGRLSDPAHADYVVSDEEVEVASQRVPGQRVQRAKRWNLQRVDGPVRVNAFEAGIWQDGWQEERSAYTRFGPPAPSHHVRVGLSQKGWCGPDPHSVALVRVVELARQRTTAVRRVPLQACHGGTGITVPVPQPPFAVRTLVAPTFVPADLDPSSVDTRHLGARVTYRYLP